MRVTTLGGRSFASSTVLNFGTQIAIFVLAFLSVPVLVGKLGGERFGLLSILWIFVGYFAFADLGVGQASIKLISESLGKGDRAHAGMIARMGVSLSLALGLFGCGVVLIIAAGWMQALFHIPAALVSESRLALVLLATCLPAVMLQGALRSVPIACNRFDIVNIVQGFSGVAQWVGSAAVLVAGGNFITVVLLTVLIRYVSAFTFLLVSSKLLPELSYRGSSKMLPVAKELLGLGSWMTVAQLIGPLIQFFERLIIGSVLSLAWVTFFTVPADAITKLVVIPLSITATLMPYVSRNWTTEEGRVLAKQTYLQSLKFVLLAVLPVLVITGVFSREILTLWLGGEFPDKSGVVLALLSVGMLFHCLAQLPNVTIYALGRPDLAAKFLLVELPVYTVACIWLTSAYGIVGTVSGWLLRVAVEAFYLGFMAKSLMKDVHVDFDPSYIWKSFGAAASFSLLCFLPVRMFSMSIGLEGVAAAAFAAMYAVAMWMFALSDQDRSIVNKLMSGLFRRTANPSVPS